MEKKTKVVQMDGLCKAGCILTIISALAILILAIIYGILFLTGVFTVKIPDQVPTDTNIFNIVTKFGGIFLVIYGSVQLLPLFFSIMVLTGRASSNIPAGVLALVFSGLIGGILILVGKYSISTTDVSVNDQQNSATPTNF